MRRTSLTFTAVLALSIILRVIPTTAQQGAAPRKDKPNQATSSQPPVPTPTEAGHQPKSQTSPTSKNAPGDNSPSQIAPTAINNQANAAQTTKEPRQKATDEEKNATTDWVFINGILMTAFTGALVVVTIGLWRVGKGQIRVTGRQNRIMSAQTTLMTGQLHATEEAANAAKRSADTTRDVLLSQAASVSVKGLTFSTGQVFGPDTLVSVIYRNYGMTRATDFHVQSWIQVVVPDYAPQLISDGCPTVITTLGPDAEIAHEVNYPAIGAVGEHQDLWNLVINGDIPLKVCSKATYKDAFTHVIDRTHHVDFEATYNPKKAAFYFTKHDAS